MSYFAGTDYSNLAQNVSQPVSQPASDQVARKRKKQVVPEGMVGFSVQLTKRQHYILRRYILEKNYTRLTDWFRDLIKPMENYLKENEAIEKVG